MKYAGIFLSVLMLVVAAPASAEKAQSMQMMSADTDKETRMKQIAGSYAEDAAPHGNDAAHDGNDARGWREHRQKQVTPVSGRCASICEGVRCRRGPLWDRLPI
jgi:hypothetical protein